MKEADSLMARRRNSRPLAPRPSVPDPRPRLLDAVLAFVRAARSTPGVLRIALIGSLATDKPVPKDADVLVTIDTDMDLAPLARLGRRLQGRAQTINLGADIFLADAAGRYLGRICHYRECWRRVACRALNCGQRQHLKDDLQIVTLSPALIGAPPIELWPRIVARCAVPADTQALLVAKLDDGPRKT
jgi:predicted nucleotidyltransferase